MRLINYGVLALSLVLVTACGKKEEAAAPVEPVAATAPAPAPAPEAAAPAMENAATPAPDAGKPEASSAAGPVCPTGCIYMNCPPPNGAKACCKQTSTGYQQC